MQYQITILIDSAGDVIGDKEEINAKLEELNYIKAVTVEDVTEVVHCKRGK